MEVEQKEYDKLLKKYKQQERRINKILKISDKQQYQMMKLNEQLEDALDKIRNYTFIPLSNGYYWNKETRNLFIDDVAINLTNYETLFIECLVDNLNETVFFEDIHNYVYSIEEFSKGALSTIVKRIRQKTTKDLIKSSPKEGYKITI